MIGSIMKAALSRADPVLDRGHVIDAHLVETVDLGPEAIDIFLLSAGRDGGERAPMEGALEGEDAVAFLVAAMGVEFARHLDGAFIGFRARIHEEYLVGEARRDEALGEALSARNAQQIRDVPHLLRLLDERAHEMGMGMAERIHRDAAAGIEIGITLRVIKPRPLASLEGEIRTRECRQ